MLFSTWLYLVGVIRKTLLDLECLEAIADYFQAQLFNKKGRMISFPVQTPMWKTKEMANLIILRQLFDHFLFVPQGLEVHDPGGAMASAAF